MSIATSIMKTTWHDDDGPPKSGVDLTFDMPVASFPTVQVFVPVGEVGDNQQPVTLPSLTMHNMCGCVVVMGSHEVETDLTLTLPDPTPATTFAGLAQDTTGVWASMQEEIKAWDAMKTKYMALWTVKPGAELMPLVKFTPMATGGVIPKPDMTGVQAILGGPIHYTPKVATLTDLGILDTSPIPSNQDLAREVMRHVPGLSAIVRCPGSGHLPSDVPMPLSAAIVHLNDYHMWSREKIADWLDNLEAQGVDLTVNFDDPKTMTPRKGYIVFSKTDMRVVVEDAIVGLITIGSTSVQASGSGPSYYARAVMVDPVTITRLVLVNEYGEIIKTRKWIPRTLDAGETLNLTVDESNFAGTRPANKKGEQ